jgi:hypothetical protein
MYNFGKTELFIAIRYFNVCYLSYVCPKKGVRPVEEKKIFFFSKMFYVDKYLKITKFIVSLNTINDR